MNKNIILTFFLLIFTSSISFATTINMDKQAVKHIALAEADVRSDNMNNKKDWMQNRKGMSVEAKNIKKEYREKMKLEKQACKEKMDALRKEMKTKMEALKH